CSRHLRRPSEKFFSINSFASSLRTKSMPARAPDAGNGAHVNSPQAKRDNAVVRRLEAGMITRRVFLCPSASLGLSLAPVASSVMESNAQEVDYPSGPVKIIVAQSAGGSLDVLLRVSAEHLSRTWGKQVVVLNMPAGGVGVIAARAAAAAPPDGYTLF